MSNRPKLLWTNSNPSSSFATQSINIDFSSYRFVIVVFDNYSTIITKLGKYGDGQINQVYNNRLIISQRMFCTYDSKITFEDCYRLQQISANSAFTTTVFNTNLIPKITKKGKVTTDKHDDLFIQKRMKILEKFINFLLKDELIKSSKIFYDFLTLQKDEDFQHVKKGYDKMKISPFIDVKERKSLDGEIKVKIMKEKEIYFENIKDNAIYNGNLLKKLNNNFKLLQDEFDAVVKRFDLISQVYRQLYDVSKNYLDQNTITEGYSQMEIMFDNLSKNFNSMKKFINSEIREYFKFIGNNFNCISEMAQNVDLCKSNYLKVSKNLINKKNDLFTKAFKNVDLPHFIWPITPIVNTSLLILLTISSFLAVSIQPYSVAFFAISISLCFLL